jgi:3D (Asp-Asp-Asp) domain-containing protein
VVNWLHDLCGSLMNKSVALLGLMLLSNSVLAPVQANAATVDVSVTTSTPTSAVVKTNPSVQELPAAPLSTAAAYTVTLTGYNAVPAQTSPTPWITASGAHSNSQVIAARSHDLAGKLPYGTIIAVLGPSDADDGPYCGYGDVEHLIGYRVIADSMAPRMHNKVDVMLPTSTTFSDGSKINPAVDLGACTGVKIQVVGYVDPSDIPATQTQLAALVNGSNQLAYAKF